MEQIKSKQLELEKMQKSQYKQEKELLRKKAEIMRMQHSAKGSARNETPRDTIKTEGNSNDQFDQSISENGDLNNVTTTNRSTASARPSSALETPSNATEGSQSGRKFDQFVKNMEERAKMRETLKRQREEKRKKQEMEKLELMKGFKSFQF